MVARAHLLQFGHHAPFIRANQRWLRALGLFPWPDLVVTLLVLGHEYDIFGLLVQELLDFNLAVLGDRRDFPG